MTAPSAPDLTSDVFAECGWRDAIASILERECRHYSMPLFQASSVAAAKGEGAKARALALELLATLCALQFGRDGEYGLDFAGLLELLSPEATEAIACFAPTIDDVELRARVADVAWSRDRSKHALGLLASESYAEAAGEIKTPQQWLRVFERLARSATIAARLGRKEAFQTVAVRVESIAAGTESYTLPFHRLLLDLRHGDPERFANAATLAAREAQANHNWDLAQNLHDVAARWHERRGDRNAARESRVAAAEARAEEAEFFASKGSHALAAHHFGAAMRLNQVAGGRRARVELLHTRMLEENKRSIAQGVLYEAPPIDLTDFVEGVRASVRGQELPPALLRLAIFAKPQDSLKLQRSVEAQFEETPLQYLFAATVVDGESGRVVAQRAGSSRGGDERETAVRTAMCQRARHHWDLVGTVFRYACEVLESEHDLSPAALTPFVTASPFVPRNRRHAFAVGLSAGLRGKYVEALSILIPQVENAIRRQLERAGQPVVTATAEGVQDEHLLGSLLSGAKAKEVLGDDLAFDLQALLQESWGANLRNRVAHGQVSDAAFLARHVAYFVWLTLYMCMLPLLPPDDGTRPEDDQPPEREPASEDGVEGPPATSDS